MWHVHANDRAMWHVSASHFLMTSHNIMPGVLETWQTAIEMKNLRTRQLALSQIYMVFPWFSTESTDSLARTPNFQRLYHCLRNVQTLILCLSGYVLIPYTCRAGDTLFTHVYALHALHALHAPYSGWLRISKHGTCRGLEMSRGSCDALVLVPCSS